MRERHRSSSASLVRSLLSSSLVSISWSEMKPITIATPNMEVKEASTETSRSTSVLQRVSDSESQRVRGVVAGPLNRGERLDRPVHGGEVLRPDGLACACQRRVSSGAPSSSSGGIQGVEPKP